MKKFYVKQWLLALCLFFSMNVFADEVTIGSLKYQLNGTEAYVSGYVGEPTDVVIPEIIVSDGLTFQVTQINASAFNSCSSITSLTSTDGNLKAINDYAFNECPNLKKVKLICAEESSIGHYSFYQCASLIEVHLSCSTIGYYTFFNCANLQKVILSDVKSIGLGNYTYNRYYKQPNKAGYTFSNCSNLTYVDLGNKLEKVSKGIFHYCAKLTYVVIPATCVNYSYFSSSEISLRESSEGYWREFGFSRNDIFDGCTRLQSIIYLGEQTPKCGSNATVYHPKEQVHWSDTEFNYQGIAPTTSFTSDMPAGFVSKADLTALEANAGTYTQNIRFTFTNDDMSFETTIPYTYTIKPVTLTAKVKDASRIYGDVNPQFSSTYTGFVNNEDASVVTSNGNYTTTATETSDVGTYAIKQTGATAQNYVFEYEDGTLTVNKAPLAMTANNKTMTYGDILPAFDARYDGLKNNEAQPVWNAEPSFSTTATAESKVGSYPITISNADAKNYQLTVNNGTMSIEKAELTINVDNKTRIYGDANPEFTLSYTGLKKNETVPDWEKQPIIETTADVKSPIGTYPVSLKDAVAVNYQITVIDGTLTVNKAALQITPVDATRKYGEENPKFELAYTGLKNNESVPEWTTDPIITTSATEASPVGDYAIQVASAEARNYTLDNKVLLDLV